METISRAKVESFTPIIGAWAADLSRCGSGGIDKAMAVAAATRKSVNPEELDIPDATLVSGFDDVAVIPAYPLPDEISSESDAELAIVEVGSCSGNVPPNDQ